MKNYLYILNKYLFYTLVFLLSWQTIFIIREVFYGTEKWHYGTIGLYISDIALILWVIFSIYLYKNLLLQKILANKKLFISAFALFLWSLISSLWATDSILAIYFSIKLFFAFTLFFLVQYIPFNTKKVSFIFIISVFIQSIIGLFQFLTQQTFAQKFLGLAHYDVWRGGSAIISTDTERWLRIYGAMPHPNIFGGLLVISLLLSITLYIQTKKKSHITHFLLLTSIALFTFNLLLTFSRVSWLTAFASLFALIVIIYTSSKYKITKLLPPFLLIFTIVFLSVVLFFPLFFSRITHDTQITHNSIVDRAIYVQDAETLITNHPVIGTGVANYTNTAFKKISNNKRNAIWQYQPVHNEYLLITAELGIVGLLLLFIFLFFYFCELIKQKTKLTLFQKTFFISTLSILFIAFFDHWMWTSHFGLFIFFLVAGLSIRQNKKQTLKSLLT